jgi:hypothetical protein
MGDKAPGAEDAARVSSVSRDNAVQASAISSHFVCSQLQTAAQYLKPIVDSIAALMNVPVVMMMPVPIPEKNGEIECLRYVSGLTSETY